MDFSSSCLENEGEDDSLFTHIPNDSALARQDGPQIDGNQTVCDLELGDKVDNATQYQIIEGDQNVEEPKEGMTFNSEEEVSLYYRQYATQAGFGVVKRGRKKKPSGCARYITLACIHQGSTKSNTSNAIKPNPTIKTGCKAKINAMLSVDGKWFLTKVVVDHNHSLSPGKARLFRCNKNLDACAKKQLELNDRTGIGMSTNFNSLVVEVGELENLPFEEKDCRNSFDKARDLWLGKGGAEVLCNYFSRMQNQNDGFFYLLDMDDEYRLRNVFWADARSKASYEYFGDVIMFDTTYLTNRYDMPFVPFMGVNHHGQSILFGAGLISSEDTNTFVWLFETWLKCMNGRAPSAIITNQDRAIKSAIAKVFPRTRHRFCLWHIMKKIPEKLGSHAQYSAIESALQTCLYDSQTCDEFDKSWQSILESYQLQDNTWLRGLYSERTFWVPAYVNDTFWAGMTTTQCNESMNAFFDGYVHSGTTLKEFVDQYDNALRKMVENESAADFSSFNSTISCISHYPIEKKFQDIYTNAKFKEVQEEFRGVMYCNNSLLKSEAAISTYQVTDHVTVNDDYIKDVRFCVYFNEDEFEVKCTCALFELRGILCRHVISVLSTRRVTSLPLKYFLNRWRKDIKRRYTFLKSSFDDLGGNPDAQRYYNMCKNFYELASLTSTSVEWSLDVMKNVDILKEKYRALRCEASQLSHHLTVVVASSSCNEVTQSNDSLAVQSNKVLSPLVVQSKGILPSKRKVPVVENTAKKPQARKKPPSDNIAK